MPSKDSGEDIAFFLYVIPILGAIAYGIYEWATMARASSMPLLAYLIVSKSQYLFLVSLVAICAAIVIEVRSANVPEREGVIRENSGRLLWLAIVVLIISLAAAISVARYNVTNGFAVFIQGRYPIIYAFFMVGISLLLSPKQILGNARRSSLPEVLGMILLVASPVIFYGGLKIKLPFAASAIGAVIVAIIGLVLLLGVSSMVAKRPKTLEPAQRQA
jgi:predicted phage tail protein